MKKEFSTKWKASSQPRKQRKYIANAPIHLKQKLLSTNLSKELRKKHNTRNIVVRKGDTVKIMRGKFSGKQGKVLRVKIKFGKIYVDGINTTKIDGSKVNLALRASNLQIVTLNLDDKKRSKKLGGEVVKTAKESTKKEKKEISKNDAQLGKGTSKSTDKVGENKK